MRSYSSPAVVVAALLLLLRDRPAFSFVLVAHQVRDPFR